LTGHTLITKKEALNFAKNQVTAIITAYNAERFIGRCIESILNQTYTGIQIIIVDDHSSDRTVEIVKTYGKKIKIFRLHKNSGPAVGRTTGLMMADSEFVSFIDADDYWDTSFVEKTIFFLQNNPEAIAVHTAYCKKDWNGTKYYRPSLDDIDAGYYSEKGEMHSDFFVFWNKYKSVLTGTVMMRTRFAQKTNGQRKELRLTQDLEFWGLLATYGRWGYIHQHLFITDEQIITPKERLCKFNRRFNFIKTMELDEWAKRIRPRLKSEVSNIAFENFLNYILTTIIFANAYMLDYKRSYQLTKNNIDRIDNRGWGKALLMGYRMGKVSWPLICIGLRYREFFKAQIHYLKRIILR